MDSSSEPWAPGRHLLLQRCKSRALACLNEHEYSRAFAHFIVALTVQPTVKGELLNAFLFTLEKLVEDLERNHLVNEVLMCYQQALDVLPNDSYVLHGLASALFRFGYVECAASYFLKSYQVNPFFTPSLYCMENLKNALVERWHFIMLNDAKRNMGYKCAIQKAVEAGYKSVLDIGAGTGIFSMIAVDAGADKVYACEASEIMSAVLQSVTEANNKPVQVLQKFSTDLRSPEDLPERVSLVVTEIFDAGLFGENSLETLHHAWEHLLQKNSDGDLQISEGGDTASSFSSLNKNANVSKLNGENSDAQEHKHTLARVIPQSATVFAVPVECQRFRKHFRLDDKILNSLDLKSVVMPQFLEEEPYSTDKIRNVPGGCKMLSSPVVLLEADFNSPQDIKSLLQGRVLNLTYQCTESGQLDAFVIWFDLHLDEEITLSTSPSDTNDSCWDQAIFFVLPKYLKGSSFCNFGDTIETEFLCREHLQLKAVNVSNVCKEENASQILTMDPTLIYLLNSYMSGNVINLNLKDFYNVDNATILDISTFPVLSLKALKDSSSVVTVLKTQYQAEVEQLQDIYHIPSERLLFRSYEDLYKTKMQCDFLVVDPVELNGLLKKNLLEDVAMLKIQCLKDTGLVIPGEIEIMATIIESSVLKEQSKIISDDKTAGYKISQIMNAYQCRIHQDIQYSTLPHQKLSQPVKLCHINLNDRSEQERKAFFNTQHKTTEIEVTNSGKATAVVYWFSIKYHTDYVVDTSNPEGLWKQAACIMDEEVQVTKGDKVFLQWSLKNGCFQIGIYDQTSSVLK